MAPRNLADFIRVRMDAMKTDTVQIERDYPTLPDDWVRGLLIGRGTKQPNRGRIKTLSKALGCDEAELWRYLGQFGRVAELSGEQPPGADDMPAWAVRLEGKVDAIHEAVFLTEGTGLGSAEALGELVGRLQALLGPSNKRRGRGPRQSGGASPPAPKANGTPTG